MEVMFTAKWMTKKIIRKKAESAIAYFLPIEELKNPLIGSWFWLLIYCTDKLLTNFEALIYSI